MNRQRKEGNRGFFLLLFCYAAAVVIMITACGERVKVSKEEEKKTVQKEPLKTKSIRADEAGETPGAEIFYHYNPMGKKDPFQPLVRDEKELAEKVKSQAPLTPLQKYSLSELKLVAIIVGLDNPRAMVEDGKGDGYIIAKGTLIGDKFGEVVEINANEVVIMEKEINPHSGEIVQKKSSLILHRSEEE